MRMECMAILCLYSIICTGEFIQYMNRVYYGGSGAIRYEDYYDTRCILINLYALYKTKLTVSKCSGH